MLLLLEAPISGRLSDSYSARMMSVLGGIVACAGIAFTGYAPNLWIAVFSFGVILGKHACEKSRTSSGFYNVEQDLS